MDKMTEEQITTALEQHASWSHVNGAIQRTFTHKDFVESMKFVNHVAELAESAQHHPDILIRWNKVTLTLTTHDAGGITDKDFDLAGKADDYAAAV
ncbi:MAG: 4a-hydroxytetrahydrobiopterin dehydratase [Planctomycetota bacterium]